MPTACPTELTQALDETSATVLRRVGIKRPPINAIEVAKRLGYDVLWDDSQQGRARIAAVRSSPGRRPNHAIFLRREPRPERIQWAVAHEIGEQCVGDLCRRLAIDLSDAESSGREHFANALATRLLLPTKWFSRDAAALNGNVTQLKAKYATASHELVARRLLDLPAPVLITIFDHGKLQFRRWNQLHRPLSLTQREQHLWRQAHELGEPTSDRGPPRIDVWTIHEPGWKREIVRLELNGDDSCEVFA